MTLTDDFYPEFGKQLLDPAGGQINIYQAVNAAIRNRDLLLAHHLLRKMTFEQSDEPEVYLLLAWTAPSQQVAQSIFAQFKHKYPDHPKAKEEAVWSGVAWTDPFGGSENMPLEERARPGVQSALVRGPRVKARPVVPVRKAQEVEHTDEIHPEGLAGRIAQVDYHVYLGIYIAGVTLAELLTTFVHPQFGLVIHGGLLIAILLHTALVKPVEQKFLLTLALAPLIRLVSLSMPLLQFDYEFWYMVIGLPMLIACAAVYRLSGFKPAHVGLVLGKNLPLQLLVAVGGVGLGLMEYLILRPEPLADTFSLQTIWLPALILLVFTGFLEELIFRGLMQRAAAEQFMKFGPLYISLLFAVLHIGYKSILDMIFVFLVGYFFSIVAEKTRSLLGVTIAHGLTNISLFLIFPFILVSPLQFSLPSFGTSMPPTSTVQVIEVVQTVIIQATATPRMEINLPAMWDSPPTVTPAPTMTPKVTGTATSTPTVTSTSTPATPTLSPTAAWVLPTWTKSPTDKPPNPPPPTATWTIVPTELEPLDSTATSTPPTPPTAVLATSAPNTPTATTQP